MDPLNNVCPTEILIDLKDGNDLTSHINKTEMCKSSNILEINSSNEKERSCNKMHETYKSILDLSPSGINEECNDLKPVVTLNTDEVQNLEGDPHDCPTAILVDVSVSSHYYIKDHCAPCSTQHFCKQDKLRDHEILSSKDQDLKQKVCTYSSIKYFSEIEETDNGLDLNEIKNQMSVKKLRWKTPSPQSMSRICKEASKVIQNLNSSAIFDDHSLLTEEIFPIPLNFDKFDLDDDSDQEDLSPISVGEQKISTGTLSINVQTKNLPTSIDITDKESNSNLTVFEDKSPENTSAIKIQDISNQLPLENHLTKMSLGSSSDNGNNSKELTSSGTFNDSFGNSDISVSYGTDDVFIMKHDSSEDKENIQEKENQTILTKGMKISKTSSKSSFMLSAKFKHRETLKNLSNIKHKANVLAKCDSLKVTTPLKKEKFPADLKETEIIPKKTQLKKTPSVESQDRSKLIRQSNSFQFQSKKELISSIQNPCPIGKDASFSPISVTKSVSSGLKQQNVFTKMKTPSRRYSICTPLKSASAVKCPSALPSFQNHAISRVMPQAVRPSRLSFSRSWQQSTKADHSLDGKVLKQQNPIPTVMSSNAPKLSFGWTNSSTQRKQPFTQSMSAITGRTSMSSSSKGRFRSKLSMPSPLPVEQDKKLARVLFPNVAGKGSKQIAHDY